MPPSARHFEALGTTCSLFVAGAPGEHLERGEAWVRALQARLTRFEPDSELSRFNASAGAWIPVSEELEDLLREALRAWELSGGLVNVAVLSAMHGIGYRRPLREGPSGSIAVATPLPALPSPQRRPIIIQAGQSGPGMDLAAHYADMQFSTRRTMASMKEHRARLDQKLASFGRKPEDCGILWSVRIQVAESEEAARAMETLPQEQREVITLHLWGGLTFTEIAEVMIEGRFRRNAFCRPLRRHRSVVEAARQA